MLKYFSANHADLVSVESVLTGPLKQKDFGVCVSGLRTFLKPAFTLQMYH